jgi:hypothetical protein
VRSRRHGARQYRPSAASLGSEDRFTTLNHAKADLAAGGVWQWLVRCHGRAVAEGAARGYQAARREAEAVARCFLDVVARAA